MHTFTHSFSVKMSDVSNMSRYVRHWMKVIHVTTRTVFVSQQKVLQQQTSIIKSMSFCNIMIIRFIKSHTNNNIMGKENCT